MYAMSRVYFHFPSMRRRRNIAAASLDSRRPRGHKQAAGEVAKAVPPSTFAALHSLLSRVSRSMPREGGIR